VIANRDAEAGREAAETIAAETGADTLAVPADVTDEAEVQVLVETTVDEFGDVDVLVNNAGIVYAGPAEEKPTGEFAETIDVNLTGAFRCAKHAGRVMIAGDGGAIVNVSSMSAFIANYPQGQADYQASKAGLEGLKHQLASEWAEYGIRVNNVNPGYVDTGFDVDEETMAVWESEVLLERFADPEEIAPLVVYLASDAAAYVTGESVVIDGGYTIR
jgi:NAD(P)-dependent dehydrogenase (short-subunit alcohol dehydrogenase family)